MVDIPANKVTQQDLTTWYEMQQQLTALKASEMLLRTKIFGGLFPNPVEGTNSYNLSDGWVLKATYPITREIDLGALGAYKDKLIEANISADKLVVYKPSLAKAIYNTLAAEQRNLFDNVLIIKPGAPSLKIELPAKAKKAGEVAAPTEGASNE